MPLLLSVACLLLPPMSPQAAPSRAAAPVAGETGAAAVPGLRIERGRITVDVGEVPVATILAAIARDLRAEVLIRGDLGVTRAQAFSDLPLLEGLERLIEPNHLLVEFAPQQNNVSPGSFASASSVSMRQAIRARSPSC